MNSTLILQLIAAATQFVNAIGPLIADAPNIFGKDDAEKIKAAADELALANAAMYERVQTKLRGT